MCDLTMSVSEENINNRITVTQQDEITFTVNFQQRGHNGFTFTVNETVFNPHIRYSGFPCTSEGDTTSLSQTLEVRYKCIAMESGIYIIEAYVTYCGRDYHTQAFTVIVENGKYIQYSLTSI